MSNVEPIIFDGLLVDFALNNNINVIIRGLRAFSDFESEFQMSLMNRKLNSDITTIFLMPHEKYTHISSSIVKEVFSLHGDISEYVSDSVLKLLIKNMKNNDFINEFINRALEKNSTIILPEINDKRIQDAIQELRDLGFNIVDIDDFSNNDKYIEYILSKKSPENWPMSEVNKYLDNPINKAMTILACNEVDGLVAGAINSTSDILQICFEDCWYRSKLQMDFKLFLMKSPNQENIYTFSDCAVIPEPTQNN